MLPTRMHTQTATSSPSSTAVGIPWVYTPPAGDVLLSFVFPASILTCCQWSHQWGSTQEVYPHPKLGSLHTSSTPPAYWWVSAVLLSLGRVQGAPGALPVRTKSLRWLINLNFFTIWWHPCLKSLQIIPSLLFNSADSCFKLLWSSSYLHSVTMFWSTSLSETGIFGYSIHTHCLHLVSIISVVAVSPTVYM